jgi:hypothetical protein
MKAIGVLGLAAALVCAVAAAQQAADAPPAPPKPTTLLAGLGTHRHPIATSNEQAQKYFDQGLRLMYAFNHDEAYRAAKAASSTKQAMPHWGMALALGPTTTTRRRGARLPKARRGGKALALSAGGPENERGVRGQACRLRRRPLTANARSLTR